MGFVPNFKISTKLLVIFAVKISIIFGASFLAYNKLKSLERSDALTLHTYEVTNMLRQMLTGLVDQESGVRGYLISGDERFLEPYRAGLNAYEKAYARARELTRNNREQQLRLDDLTSLANVWHEQRAEQAIALMSNPRTREQALEMEASGVGKNLMDDMREVLAKMVKTERALLISRYAQERQAIEIAYVWLVAGCVTAMAASSVAAYLLIFGFARKLGDMTGLIKRLASGDQDVEVAGTDRQDEIGDMARALQMLKEYAADVTPAAGSAADLRRIP